MEQREEIAIPFTGCRRWDIGGGLGKPPIQGIATKDSGLVAPHRIFLS